MSNESDRAGQESPTILIVEDERGLAELYSVWLSEYYDVRTAYSGREALERLRLRGPPSTRELLTLLSRKIALEEEHRNDELEGYREYIRLTRRVERAVERFEFVPRRSSSKYRPSSCPECDFRWDIRVEGSFEFVTLAARVYKCIRCGHVERPPDPRNRHVARR